MKYQLESFEQQPSNYVDMFDDQPRAVPEVGFSEAFDAARELESTAANYAWMEYEASLQEDPDYTLPEGEEWDALIEGIPYNLVDEFSDARSGQHAEFIRNKILRELDLGNTLSNYGPFKGITTQLGAALFDEGAVALALTTSPAVAAIVKGNRLRRFVAGGMAAGFENAALEQFLSEASKTRDFSDVLLAGVGGFALGGGIAAIGRTGNDQLAKAVHQLQNDIAADQAQGFAEDTAGAAGVLGARPNQDIRQTDTFDIEDANRTAFGKMRFDVVGRLKSSENPLVRQLGGLMAEDAVGNADNSVNAIGASEVSNILQATQGTRFYRKATPAFSRWAKRNNASFGDRFTGNARRKFFSDVSRAVRTGPTGDPDVDAVASEMRGIFKTFLDRAKAAGVKGFSDIDDNPNYLPRLLNMDNVRRMTTEYDHEQLIQLLKGAIQREQVDLDDVAATAIARGYFSKVRKTGANMELNFGRIFSQDNKDLVEEILVDAGLDEEARLNITRRLEQTDKSGRIDRAKRRTTFDEDYALKIPNKETGLVDTVRVTDFFEDDAEQLINSYMRQLSGHIGLAEQTGIKSRGEFASRLEDIRSESEARGIDANHRGGGKTATQKDTEALEWLYDALTGVPLEKDPNGVLSRVGRFARDWNFARLMNQVGFAQLAEIGNLMGQGGFRNMIRHMPAMRSMLKRMENGDLEDGLARELEAITGFGTDFIRNTTYTRYDEYGYGIGGGVLNTVNQGLQHAKRATGVISGMMPINTVMHRMTTRVIAQNFMDAALGKGRKLTPNRLAALGIDEDTMTRIKAQLNKHSVTSNGTLKELNVDQWDDQDAADALVHGVSRLARKIIQENDIGNTHEWMSSTLGKVALQFRSFMLVAYNKQLLAGLHQRDWQTFASWSLSMLFGGLAYSGQTYINSFGRSDQSEYLQERLDPAEIGKAAFQRAAFASLIPAAVDSVWTRTIGDDPIFAYGRSTGLASDAIMGNPTVDLFNKIGNVTSGAIKAPLRDDYQWSQRDMRNMTSLMVLSNMLGIRNVMQAIQGSLPEQSD